MNHPSRTTVRNVMYAFAIAMFMVAALLPLSLKAQSFYGSMVGTVTDSSGAVVPNATVKVTNMGTNETQSVESDAGGKYSVVNLVPADYSVEVTKANFKRFLREHIPVQVGQTTRIDPALAVGNASETVQVTTAVPLLQTDSSTQGQEVEGDQVQQMPLNGRNVLNLIALAPGVVPTGAAMGDTGLNQGTRTAGGVGWGNYQIGGSIQGQGGQYLDGVPNNLLGGNVVALVPTQDAIQELNVASSNASADFGRFSGGVVNMTTKSGTNSFHGSVYEYLRNNVFNANDYFSNLAGAARPVWNQNQYGASVTGPIVKDKLFFMFTWEGFHALTGNITPTNVPTLALQNGVFLGETLPADPLGACNILPIPAGGVTVNGTTYTGAGSYIANLYGPALPNTNGLATCGDPSNEVMKQFYPLPNSTLASSNWFTSTPLGNHQEQYNGRVDFTASEKQRLFARYTYWAPVDQPHTEFNDQGYKNGTTGNGTTWPTNDGQAGYYTTQGVIGDTYSINPTTVADVRLNYVRQYDPNLAQSLNVNESQFGTEYAALASQMDIHEQPAFNPGGVHNLYNMGNYPNDSITWYNTYGVNANLTKILGSHSLKVGGELRLMDQSSINPGGGSGKYSYNTSWLNDEWANFLLGYSSQAQFPVVAEVAAYTYYQAYYVTDNWQASRSLTLNLGIRYELPGSIAERNNKATVLLPNAVDPYTGIKGTETLVASPLYGARVMVQPKYNLFAPRVGFAYRAGANTVVRGGYGISYLPNDLETNILPGQDYINSATTTVNPPGSANPIPLQTILAGFVATGLNKPAGRSNPAFMKNLASATSYLGQNITNPVPYQNYPYTQQWNAALSHQFKGDMMVEASYSGLKGTNMPGIGGASHVNGWVLDQLPDGTYNSAGVVTSGPFTGDSLTATTLGTTKFQCPNTPGFAAGAISVGQCMRPYPYYNNVADTAEYNAVQNYRAFLVRAEKRMGANGVLNANYTWSQSRGNTDTQASYLESKATAQGGNGDGQIQDFDNPKGEISLISFDVTNRAIISYLENLPFGKGQKYGNSFSNGMNALVTGWAINGITTFQSGFPVFLYVAGNSQLSNSFGAGVVRPMDVPGCNPKIGGSGLSRAKAGAWFNTSCFENVGATGPVPFTAYQFGNEPRVNPILRGDGIKNFDFAFQKSTPIHESVNFEFRAEAFNIFNRVQFAPPVDTVGGANYGNVTYQVNRPRQLQVSGRINF